MTRLELLKPRSKPRERRRMLMPIRGLRVNSGRRHKSKKTFVSDGGMLLVCGILKSGFSILRRIKRKRFRGSIVLLTFIEMQN